MPRDERTPESINVAWPWPEHIAGQMWQNAKSNGEPARCGFYARNDEGQDILQFNVEEG